MALRGVIDVAEQKRLNSARDAGIPWKKRTPYLRERHWGTVREDTALSRLLAPLRKPLWQPIELYESVRTVKLRPSVSQ